MSLNYAENILYSPSPTDRTLRSKRHKEDSKVALVEVREALVSRREVTWGQLRDRTAVFAAAMRANGVRAGDRVAVVMSNSFHTLCVYMATTSLNAIFSSSSTDMGSKGILERLRQIEPQWVFVDDAALYNGQRSDLRGKMKELVAGMSGVSNFQGLVSVPWGSNSDALDVSGVPRATTLQKFLDPHSTATAKDLTFERLPFHHGFLIVYSSGTTGSPKCIVHSTGGALLSAWKEGALQHCTTPASTTQQFTTTGWIMYMISVGAMLHGSKLIMYDGSPFQPRVDTFLRLAAKEGTTHLGVSPRWFQSIRTAGVIPRNIPGTEKLQVVNCTGMVLPSDMFRWFHSDQGFHQHTQLGNVSGGTDIAGAFGDFNPLDPVHDSGGCQCWTLGLDVRVFDSTLESVDGSPVTGRAVPDGEPGDLVCVKAFPNMPIQLWGDDGGKKYQSAYFERFDNVWTHGDFVQVEPATRSIIFLGRADGVLNPSGIRFGSAEVYSVIENMFADAVEDSVCVGQRRKGDRDESVVLFVKMKGGKQLTAKLIGQLKESIARELSKRHVPKYIFETPEIPVSNLLTT